MISLLIFLEEIMRPLSIAISFFLIFFSFMVSAQTFGPTQNHQGKRMAKQQQSALLDAKEIDLLNAQVTALQAQLTEAENTNQQLTMAYQNAIAMLESSKRDFQSMSQSAQSAQSTNSILMEQLTQYRHQFRFISPAHLSGMMRQFRDNAFSLTSFKPNMTITPVGGVIETHRGGAEMQGTTHPFTLMTVVALIILLMILLSMLSGQQKKIAVVTALKQEGKAEENEEDKDYPAVTSDELDSESFARSVKNYQYLSGEDVETSKLDLSKAYIEMGSYTHARRVLESVIQAGNESQQAEAKKLLHMIENKS